jgi:hypothetical protein
VKTGDAAFERVNQSQQPNDEDRPQPQMRQSGKAGAEHRAQNKRCGENAHALGQRPHDQKQRCREVLCLRSEPSLQQFISSQQLAFKVRRDEKRADDYPCNDVAEYDL